MLKYKFYNNKAKTILSIAVLSIGLMGCKENQETDIVEAINSNETTTVAETTVEEVISEVVTTEATQVEEVIATPTDDSYELEQIDIQDISLEDIQVIESTGLLVTDQNVISELEKLCDKFFYNFLFKPDLETGVITPEDMQAFAISYIAQYEYSELKFDTEKFISYIPDHLVSEIIDVFFATEFYDHKDPVDERIKYVDFDYLMPAIGEIDLGEMSMMEVYDLTGGIYKATFEEILEYRPVDSEKEHYEAIFKSVEDRYVLLSYKKVTDSVEEAEGEEVELESTESE